MTPYCEKHDRPKRHVKNPARDFYYCPQCSPELLTVDPNAVERSQVKPLQ